MTLIHMMNWYKLDKRISLMRKVKDKNYHRVFNGLMMHLIIVSKLLLSMLQAMSNLEEINHK